MTAQPDLKNLELLPFAEFCPMAEIVIDDLQIVSDGKSLTFTSLDQPSKAISLKLDQVEKLVNFVSSIDENEFNRRLAYRVPIFASSGVTAQIRMRTEWIHVKPVNLSLTGMFVEVSPDCAIDLIENRLLEVALEFDGEKSAYTVLVRRREDDGFGLFFTESINGEQIVPLPGIRRIVMELQRRMLAVRNDSDDEN